MANTFQLSIQRLATGKGVSRILSHLLYRVDRTLLRLSNGRLCATSLLAGVPVALVTMRGRKSGIPRSVPLLAIPDGRKLILVASYFGNPRHPSWYYNLREHPQVEVISRHHRGIYSARELNGIEYDACWRQAIKVYAGFEIYRHRAEGRHIPVLLLDPVAG